jgi:hypothetical protein
MHLTRLGIVTVAGLVIAGIACAQQLIRPQAGVVGSIEQWAPGARVVKVDGQTYRLSPSVQVLDNRAALKPLSAVRPGTKVQLLIAGGDVSHVIIDPGLNPVMDQPQR